MGQVARGEAAVTDTALIELQNTYVVDPCQKCGTKAELWKTRFGVNLNRLCLRCWGVALGIVEPEVVP